MTDLLSAADSKAWCAADWVATWKLRKSRAGAACYAQCLPATELASHSASRTDCTSPAMWPPERWPRSQVMKAGWVQATSRGSGARVMPPGHVPLVLAM